MITPFWLSGSLRPLLYSSSVYFCHPFLSSVSVRSIPLLYSIRSITPGWLAIMLKNWSWTFLWRPIRPSRTNSAPPQKKAHFIIGDWNTKVGSQEIPGVTWKFSLGTKWSRAQVNKVLPKVHYGHSKHPLLTTPETTLHLEITRCSIPKSDWLHSLQPNMEKLYTVSNKTGSWLWFRW